MFRSLVRTRSNSDVDIRLKAIELSSKSLTQFRRSLRGFNSRNKSIGETDCSILKPINQITPWLAVFYIARLKLQCAGTKAICLFEDWDSYLLPREKFIQESYIP